MPKRTTAQDRERGLREQILVLLTAANAHANFEDAVRKLPAGLQGKRPEGCPHSPWELVEHMRIAQWDILEFSRNAQYKSPEWPGGYWPVTAAPPDEKAWGRSLRSFRSDLKAMCALVADPATDLYKPIPHGTGQTIVREALLVADHNAYHVGQLVLVRKMLGAW